ncbi:aspartic peptidase domain-containing protein, partial [Lophiotrema nucula]
VASIQQDLLTLGGRVYMTNITLGSSPPKPYTLVIDTGSSDTWIASSAFQCLSKYTQKPLSQSACGFGDLYDEGESESWEGIPSHGFEVRYTDGEFLSGDLGIENLEIGGLTTRQTIGVVDSGWWIGDNISSGLMGLAYPILTSGHQDLNYTSVVFSLFEDGDVPPIFSLALSRPSATSSITGGLLALGGIPDIPYSGAFVTVPIRPIMSTTYAFYSVPVDGFAIAPPPAARGTTRPKIANFAKQATEMTIDSGTTLIYFPDTVADYVAGLFNPPAMYNKLSNLYIVNCSSKAPRIGVIIAGQKFFVNEKDLLNGGAVASRKGWCVLAIQRQGQGDAVLGDAFLKNVVAVFDVGENEMMFAAREKY